MLILARRVYETITLDLNDGRTVTIALCEIRVWPGAKPKAYIGISAPDSVRILRTELLAQATQVTPKEVPHV